jgi:hypothetical protein
MLAFCTLSQHAWQSTRFITMLLAVAQRGTLLTTLSVAVLPPVTRFGAGGATPGVSEGLKVAAERLSWGFSGAAAALKAPLHHSDSLGAKAKRALRAAPKVNPLCQTLKRPPQLQP